MLSLNRTGSFVEPPATLLPRTSDIFGDSLRLASPPILKVDWWAEPDRDFLIPAGGGVGEILRIGKVPMTAEPSAHYNGAKRDFDADRQLRVQVQFLLAR